MITFLLIFCNLLHSQIDLPKQTRSAYEGKEFVVSFMQNEVTRLNPNRAVDQKIIISSRFNASATITTYDVSNNRLSENIYNITPTNSRKIVIPEYFMCNQEGEVVKKNILIRSNRDISVVCYSSQYTTSDMYSAIPVSRWGTEYQAITHGVDHYDSQDAIYKTEFTGLPRSGQFLIMANEDNTEIKFTPRAKTKSRDGNQEYTIILNKWESYLVQADESLTKMAYDLSGSIIRSNKPIGVLSGHMRTAITPKLLNDFGDSKDHLIEMLNPSNLFGKEYVTAPFGQSIKNYFCLTTIEPNTVVEVLDNEGTQRIFLDFPGARKYIRIDGAAKWTSNNKFQLAQFMARYGEDDEECNEFYDPSYVIIQPVDYFNNNLNFLTIGYNESDYGHAGRTSECGLTIENQQYIAHYAMIIAKEDARFNITVDGVGYPVTNFEGTVPGTDYYFGYIQLEPGQHVISTNGGGFQALIYGRGYYDSYAYSLGGASIPNSESSLDDTPPEISILDNCDEIIVNIEDKDANPTGIQFIDIIDNRTYNVNISGLNQSGNFASLIANQIDKRQDAQITFQYYDNAGNGREYTHNFIGQNPDIVDKNLGQIELDPNLVYFTTLRNLNDNEVEVTNLYFSDNSYYLQNEFQPFVLSGSEQKEIGFLIRDLAPENIPNEVYLILETNCKVLDTAFIQLQKISYSFFGNGIDLGDIPLGSEKCGPIYFENNGNLNLILTKLDFEKSIVAIDTIGVNNIDLLQEERINIESCVQPFERNFPPIKVTATAIGFYGEGENAKTITLTDEVEVTYHPVGAIFNDIFHDFGNVIIDEKATFTIEIENIGDLNNSPTFNYLNIASNGKLSQDNDITITQIEQDFTAGQKINFTFSFEPTQLGYYDNIITFDYLEGVLLRQFNIQIVGNGINNKINGFNNCFHDTLFVNEEVNEIEYDIFEYQGNVDKTLYNIRPLNSYFTNSETGIKQKIPYSDSDIKLLEINKVLPKQLENNEVINGLFSFIPTKYGFSELEILAITTSSEEGKLFDSTIVTICANSKLPLYPELEIMLSSDNVWACDTTELLFIIRNTGETDILLNEINLSSDYFTEFSIEPEIPKELKVSEAINLPLKVFRFKDETEEVEISTVTTDLLGRFSRTYTYKHQIEPKFTQLILPDLDFSYNIGDSSIVNIYGDIPYNIDIPAKLKIRIYAEYQLLWLLSETAEIVITKDGNITKRIPFKVNKNLNDIQFGLDYFEFEVNGNERWSIDLLFKIMLSQYFDSEIIVEVFYDECFKSIRKSYPVKLNEVCAQPYRVVEYFDKGDINFAYDLKKSELFIKLDIPVSSNYTIYLVDMLGKKYPLEEKKFVNSGKYFLNYDLKKFPNGNYFLNIDTKFIKETKQIIIIK